MRFLISVSLFFIILLTLVAPSPAHALSDERIYYYGDSIAAESFPYFKKAMQTKVSWLAVDRSLPGSSPCDWYARLAADMRLGTPRIVMIESFGNNISRCQIRNGSRANSESNTYWQRYQADLNSLVSRVPTDIPVWLSPAAAARNDLSAGTSHKARMLSAMQAVARAHSNVKIVDAGAAVELPGGQYSPWANCLPKEPCTNQPALGKNILHARDGLHFCPAITNATIALLRHCPVYASGAYRFANAQADAAASSIS